MLHIDVPTSELRIGDKVAAKGDSGEFEVRAIEAHQGRLQVVDAGGGIHTYWRTSTVHLTRRNVSA